MTRTPDEYTTDVTTDVLVAGGGLAGLTLALQIRQELPNLRVTVVERTARPLPVSGHKEVIRFGLRFFPGGGDRPVDERWEVGPGSEPIASSYQTDRGLFEDHLRDLVLAEGGTLREGASVREVALGTDGAPHCITVREGESEAVYTTRWFIDATGRAGLLRKKLKLRRGTGHASNAGWFRVTGKLDINEMVSDPDSAWRQNPTADERWRSTNHFMGTGYWVWTIPLASGNTSVGVVAHEAQHEFGELRTLERCRAFLAEHEPHLNAFLQQHLDAGHEVMDFLCLKGFSYMSSYSTDVMEDVFSEQACMTTATEESSSFPSDLSDYRIVFLLMNTTSFSSSEIATMRSFVDDGGVLVVAGETTSFNSGYVPTFNSVLTSLGLGTQFLPSSSYDSGCGKVGTRWWLTTTTSSVAPAAAPRFPSRASSRWRVPTARPPSRRNRTFCSAPPPSSRRTRCTERSWASSTMTSALPAKSPTECLSWFDSVGLGMGPDLPPLVE